MDDANLAKLSVNQPGLRPDFHKDTTEYSIIVASNVNVLNITASTSDKNASFSIKSSTGYGEEVKLNEGENKITIEVSSEDGTIKKYLIDCKRLSASDANLKQIEFDSVKMKPLFDPNICEYSVNCEYKTTDVNLKLELYDPNCSVEVVANDLIITNNANSSYNYTFSLNFGYSVLLVKCTSPNKSNTKVINF